MEKAQAGEGRNVEHVALADDDVPEPQKSQKRARKPRDDASNAPSKLTSEVQTETKANLDVVQQQEQLEAKPKARQRKSKRTQPTDQVGDAGDQTVASGGAQQRSSKRRR